MGGCRCTYRNCTVKSDGKTHMFHYPVFEKVRCHKWLQNANRLEFLNLKVSQLKNRVVCQHHFKEEDFMNYKKDKLKFEAVPTENGPFCDSSTWSVQLPDAVKTYPIILEDIENDCVPFCDKKANFSLKYGDFLTNCELMDLDDNEIQNNVNLKNDNSVLKTVISECNDEKIIPNNKINQLQNLKLSVPFKYTNKPPITSPFMTQPYSVNSLSKHHTLDVPQSKPVHVINTSSATSKINNKNDSKIRIIAEKKIEEPIILTGSFRKLSPSTKVLPSLIKKENNKPYLDIQKNNVSSLNAPLDSTYTVQVEYDPNQSNINNTAINNVEIMKSIDLVQPHAEDTLPESKISLLKNKITPERMAVIENKRKFNMKMKNIIEARLENKEMADVQEQPNNDKIRKTIPSKKVVKTLESVPVSSGHESEPNIQDSSLKYLEERLKNMEKTLLNRIDQNSQRIFDLKTSIINQEKNVRKNDISVQTCESEEAYKRFLYQEISKYLSSDSNSAIYEELFINKFCVDDPKYSLRNKKKKRG